VDYFSDDFLRGQCFGISLLPGSSRLDRCSTTFMSTVILADVLARLIVSIVCVILILIARKIGKVGGVEGH
jgi:hypothetical protein